ncbi:hypothetical protein BHE74_00004858 [Ensete ventricosum]|nr:hypothetical protein BHE74_00004858 [Ensete ventricosum]
MRIVELEDGREKDSRGGEIAKVKAKRALVGAGARILFYPTLIYNVIRNKVQAEFHWWDEIDKVHGINHLVIPTRDYLFAPSIVDIYRACKLEFPAIRSPRSTDLLKGDEVLISEADLEGYNVGEDTKDLIISSCKIAEPSPMIVKHMTESPIGGDEVLVTEADLEGYETFMIACEDRSLSSNVTAIVPARTRMVMRRLCCICTSLKSSTGGQPVASRFHEIHALDFKSWRASFLWHFAVPAVTIAARAFPIAIRFLSLLHDRLAATRRHPRVAAADRSGRLVSLCLLLSSLEHPDLCRRSQELFAKLRWLGTARQVATSHEEISVRIEEPDV